ncbi:MAG TPA: feruloyl-CoA synthase [Burkholderiales bacterium]
MNRAGTHRAAPDLPLGPSEVDAEWRADGTVLLRSPHPLEAWPDRITDHLGHWARADPARVLLAERAPGGGWRTLSYGEALEQARRVAGALLARGLSAERPVVVLSGNDIEHALLQLGALIAGIAYAPVSPAYSLLSEDFGKLRHIIGLLTPGLVFAADGQAFGRALATVVPPDTEVVVTRNPPTGRGSVPFAALTARAAGTEVDAAHAKVGPDTIAKFLFTSGSTGVPKAVINTQRMWCSNQAMIRTMLAFFREEPPVLVDWAPWHHTAAGNHDFGLVLANGGSYYIDEGKPMPGAIETTVRNLREIAPTFYFNVPRGYEALLPFLREDAALRKNFFSRLRMLWFAAAAVPQHVYDELRAMGRAARGAPVPFLTGLGSTETAPLTLARLTEAEDAANMGVPPPGVELKMVPFEGRFEMRVKGPHITPGYWRQPALTAQAFDEEGWYRLGDAFEFADAADASKGLLFRGRVAEDFKLDSGTWVHVGPLRAACIAQFAPLVRDVVIAGAGRDALAALVFPDEAACAKLGDAAAVRAAFHERLAAFAGAATGSATRITRLVLLQAPPSLDAGEMTDKGSINQRAVLARRADVVAALYAEPPEPDIITAGDTP